MMDTIENRPLTEPATQEAGEVATVTEVTVTPILSKEDVTQAANTLSLAITAKMTLTQLAQADFFFQPGFSRPWHFLNVLALRAKGQTYGSTEMLF